jgi:Flavodoxin-like fold
MAYRILVLFAHPALQKSTINQQLIAAIRDLENVTINDLYEEYPDFYINVKREQRLLIDNDIIIFQRPFYRYASPAILNSRRTWHFGLHMADRYNRPQVAIVQAESPEDALELLKHGLGITLALRTTHMIQSLSGCR